MTQTKRLKFSAVLLVWFEAYPFGSFCEINIFKYYEALSDTLGIIIHITNKVYLTFVPFSIKSY